MKVPALLLIAFLLSAQVFVAGIPLLQPTMQRTSQCCQSMQSCNMNGAMTQSGTGHCACNTMPASAMASSPCSCSHNRMMAPAQTVSERVRQYILRGYRRITRKNVLDHESRKILYSLIVANPGMELKSLADLSGLNEHTIKYHLDQIVAAGHVSVCHTGNNKHYFENHGTYSSEEQQLLSRYHQGSPGRILITVRDNPGVSRGDIARLLGVSGPVISRSMQPLIDEGFIRQVPDGKFRRYYPGWDPGLLSHSRSA